MRMSKALLHTLSSYLHKLVLAGIGGGALILALSLGEYQSDFESASRHFVVKASQPEFQRLLLEGGLAVPQGGWALPPEEERFASPEAARAALVDVAESSYWRQFDANMEKAQADLRAEWLKAIAIGEKTQKTLSRPSEKTLLQRKEALTRLAALKWTAWPSVHDAIVKAAATAHIERAPFSLPGTGPINRVFGDMFDPASPHYQLFKGLWSGSLAVAICCFSYLFLVLLATIPITATEGFWSDRIKTALGKLSSAGGPEGGAKILSAVMAVGLSGAVAVPLRSELAPGGTKARTEVVERERRTETHTERIVSVPSPGQPLDLGPLSAGLEAVKLGLDATGAAVDQTNIVVANLSSALNESRDTLAASIKQARSNVSNDLHNDLRDFSTRIVERDSAVQPALQALASANVATGAEVASLQAGLADVTSSLHRASSTVDAVKSTHENYLVQASAADERGFWGRTFGRTHFQVTPLTAFEVTTYLEKTDALSDFPPQRAEALSKQIYAAIEGVPSRPMSSTELIASVRQSLGGDADDLIPRFRQTLLHVTALPR